MPSIINGFINVGDQALWLALIIGNSRWHWGAFENNAQDSASQGQRWLGSWHSIHLSAAQMDELQRSRFARSAWQQLGVETTLPANLDFEGQGHPEIWLASVVNAPLSWLVNYPNLHLITTDQVPLRNTYATLGVDRALALVGAGDVWGWPVLVVDCGTALSFTAGVDQCLIGGAILPGLRSQFRALQAHTDQLPALDFDADSWLDSWPQRWATHTAEAIASGILHTQIAGIRDFIHAWIADYPAGAVVLTGGDSEVVMRAITKQTPTLAQRIEHDLDLGFWGVRVCRRQRLRNLEML